VKGRPLINQFNVGEVSGLLDARLDVQKYYGACRRLENMIPLIQGGARRRPGSYYIAASKYGTKKSRLFGFHFSTVQAYMTEFGDQHLRFYMDKGRVVWYSGEGETKTVTYKPANIGDNTAVDQLANFYNNVTETWIGKPGGANWWKSAIRFEPVSDGIPNNATIISAKITFNAHANWPGEVNAIIYGNDADDATAPTDGAAFNNLDETTEYVEWDNVAEWTAGENYDSPDITDIVQEIVDRSGYADTSAIQMEIFDNGSANTAGRGFHTYKEGAAYAPVLTVTFSNVYEIATPFTEDELFELSFAQSADTLFIAHPSHKPMELTRTSDTAWTLNYRTFKYGDDRDITGATQANPVVITSVAHDLEVGQWVKFSGIVGMTELNDQYGKITAITDDTFTIGAIDSSLYGAYTTGGVAQLLEFKGTKKAITGAAAAKPVEITCVSHGLSDGDLIWIDKVIGMIELNNRVFTIANKTDDTFELTDGAGADIDGSGYTAYTSGGYSTPTIFTAEDDYPGAVGFFEQRLVYGGSNNQPQTLWLSESGAYDTFNITQTGDDVAIEYTLASERVDRIKWFINQEYLMVGTVGGVYKFGATTTSEPVTQSNVNAKRQTTFGVKEDVPARLVGDSILYVQTGGRTVRDLYYTINKPDTAGGYSAGNLTALAEHIAKGTTEALSGITDIDYQQEPFSILWCTRADGQLLALVYDREQQLVGWARMWTGDEDDWDVIESVAVINNGEMENEVWISVKRTIGGTDYRYIEYFKPHEFFSQIKDGFFVDSGLTWDGGDPVAIAGISKHNPAVVTVSSWPVDGNSTDLADGDKVCIYGVEGMTEVNIDNTTAYTVANANKGALTFELSGIDSSAYTAWSAGGYVKIVTNSISSGLDHLEGRDVDILNDGVADTQQEVTGGALPSALTYYGNLIHVGLPYTPYLMPMKPEAGLQQGTTAGLLGRIYHLYLSVYESYGVKAGKDGSHLYDFKQLNEATPSLCTGFYEMPFNGNVGKDLDMLITNEGPYPMTIRAIVPSMEKFGGP